MSTHLTGGRIWLDEVEITHFLRTGNQALTIDDQGRVVFAATGTPWALGPYGIEIGSAKPREHA